MKKVKVIFPDGSIAEIDESELSGALSAGAKRHTEKSTTMVFKDGSIADISDDDIEGAISAGAVKKKVSEDGGVRLPLLGKVGGTVGTSKAQSKSPETKIEVTETNFTENVLDPTTSLKKQKENNTVFINSTRLPNIEITDDNIPADIMDKAGYRTALQQRINSKSPEQIDLQVISTTTKIPVEAVEAYTKGRDGKGIMIEFDAIKKNKFTELENIVNGANQELGLTDTFEGVFATPETASLYIDKIQNGYQQKAAQEAENFTTGNKAVFLPEGMVDKELADIQTGMKDIGIAAQQKVSKIKSIIGEDILSKIEKDESLTYDQKVKKAGDLIFKNELSNVSEARYKRGLRDTFGAFDLWNKVGSMFRDKEEENQNLNSVKSIVETRLQNSLQQDIVYKQAALSDMLQIAMEKANAGTLTEEEKTNYQEMVSQLQTDIDEKKKEYKSPQQLQKEYPVLLKQSVIGAINEFNAIQSGNIKGYGDAGYEGITMEQHLKANGYDMNSQVVKDAIEDAKFGDNVKDYSFFGEPLKAISEVFKSSAKSLGTVVGLRDDVTALSEKKASELFPTTVGANDEMQLTTAAKTVQNITNTTGQVIGQGLLQASTVGLGRLAGLSKVAAANTGFWSSGALTSYDQAYKDSFDFIDSGLGRTTYAGLIALSNAASEKLFPEAKIFDIPGVKSAYSELASKIGTEGFTDKLANQLLTKAQNAFVDYGKKYLTNVSKETIEEVGTSIFESGARFVFGDPNMNVQKAIADAKNTAIQTAIGTSLIGGMGAHRDVQQERNVAPSSIIYNAAVYKDEAMDALTIGYKEGLYDEVEYNNKVSLLNTAEVSLSELKKAEQVIGRELTRPQKELFVANSTAQKVLIEQKKGVEDEAVIATIDEKLKNLQSQQKQLLENKVQIDEFGNVVVPVKETETVVETPTAEVNTETTTVVPAAEIINSLEGNDQIPAFELQAMKADPEMALREIADQALGFGRNSEGVRSSLNETAPEPQLEATVRKYGQEVVDKAIAMFPAENIEVTEAVTEQPESAPEVKPPTNKKERLAAFKNKFVAPTTTPQEQKQWNELSMGEKLALAKENLPEVDNLSNVEAVKVADQNAKILLEKLNKTPESAIPVKENKITGVAYHGITAKEGKSKGIYLADEATADAYSDGTVEQYDYTLNKPYIVEKDTDFDVVNKIIDEYVKGNPDAKFHPDITGHVNSELEKMGYDGLIIKEEAIETEKGYSEIGGTYGEPQIIVFDRKNVSKIEPTATTSQTIKTKSNEVQQESGSGVQASVSDKATQKGQGNKSDQKEVKKETGGKAKKAAPVSEEKRVFTVTGNQRSVTENTVRNKQNKSSLLNKLKELNAPQALIDNVNAESKILGYNGESLKMFLRTGGFYRDGENDIHINPFVSLVDGRYKSKDRAIVHEAVHLVAFDNVQKYLDDDYENLNGKVIDSLDYINDSLEKAKSNFTGPQAPYGFTNLHEFISEFISNPAFRNTVARNLDTGKTGLTKILDAIKDFFSTITGIPIKSSLNIDELTEINKKIESVYGKRETGQRNNDTNPLFSIQAPTSQEISDMKDIVKDYVDEGTASLQDIQDDVAKELGDNSQEMRDLVEKAYNEFTKDTDFAPKEITGGVIGRVGKFLSRLFGGTAASKVFILKDTAALQARADQLQGDVKYQKSLKDYINIVLTSIALSATPVQTGTTKVPVATEINEGETKTRNTIKKLLTDYYAVNEETVPKEVIDRALKVWERVGRPEILPDSTKNDDRAYATYTNEGVVEDEIESDGIVPNKKITLGNITNFEDFLAELAHAAQYTSKTQLDEKGYATQQEYDAVEYDRVGSVEYDAHKIIEPMIAAYILKGKKAVDAKDIDGAVEKYGLKNVLYQFKENDLNLQNESELQKYLPDTLSPTEKQGSIAGGEANAAATVITGTIQAANEAVKGGSNWLPSEKLKNKEGKYLEQHAKETNTWIEEDFGKPDANGFEQDVYLNPDGKTVTKVHSNVTHDTWNDLFHRIAIHNTLFPDVAYTLKGFTKHNFSPYNIANDYRELAAVFEQPLITKGGEPIKYTEVVDELSKLGFEPAKSNEVKKDGSLPNVSVTDADSGIRFINPTTGVEISDLHGENVMRGTDGKIHFIDPIIELTEDRKNGKINFMKNPNGDILGFTHNNIVYLNAEHINPNTPIHESSHIFLEWAKTNQPEVYTRGMQLTENSKYLKAVKDNEFYKEEAKKLGSESSKAYNDYMKHEALAMAIGDKGAQFVGETRKKDFKEWLNNLWNKIKSAAGFTGITASELHNLTFDEFTKRAAADILREEEQTPAEPELSLKETADQIRKEELSYNDAIEGKPQTFVDELNHELFGSKKVNFDTDAFKAQVKKQKSFGLTEAEVIEGFEAAKKLTKIQKGLIAEIFAETAETDKVAAELKEAFKALAKGEKPKGVLKRLGVSNVTELVNALRDSLTYNAVSNDQLDAMADFIVDSIDLNKADQYLNALINNSVADVRQILRAKLIVALQKEGNTELATKLISEMADEATVSGRQTQSLKRAYEILGAQGNPATRTEFAKRYAEAVQEKARQMTQDLGNVISEREAEIGKLNQKIHQKTQDSPLINKIKEVIANLCGLRSKK